VDARDRLIIALDVPTVAQAEATVARIGDAACFYKVGYQLAFAGGLDFARALIAARHKVFIDLKLHDIGNTVARLRRLKRHPWEGIDAVRQSLPGQGG